MKVDLPIDWHPFLNGMREKLDALIERGAEVGGDIDDAVEALRAARTHIIDTWRTALGTDNEALKALEKAESVMHAPEEVEMLSNEFLRQLSRKDGPICAEDVVPSLLTESCETIRLVRRFLRDQGETVQRMQAAGAKIVAECVAGGEHIDQAMEKLEALGITDQDQKPGR